MKIIVVAGYGDKTGYLETLTQPWLQAGHDVHVHPFGTVNGQTYDHNWKQVEAMIEPETGFVGVSFGFSVALRALVEHPGDVCAAVGVAGPHSLEGLDVQTVRNRYPQLIVSLERLDMAALDPTKTETWAPLVDGVIPPQMVPIDGARHHRVLAAGHPLGIIAAFLFHRRPMLDFLTEQRQRMIACR